MTEHLVQNDKIYSAYLKYSYLPNLFVLLPLCFWIGFFDIHVCLLFIISYEEKYLFLKKCTFLSNDLKLQIYHFLIPIWNHLFNRHRHIHNVNWLSTRLIQWSLQTWKIRNKAPAPTRGQGWKHERHMGPPYWRGACQG